MSSKVKQTGFVSIIVAALLMVILALITVGFTRLMQREQRQSIDRQLSRQALYAAESGINDVVAAIAAGTPGYTGTSKTTCDVSGLPNGGDLSGDGTIAYTCALFDEEPGSLDYEVGVDGSKIVQLSTSSGNTFNTITVSWGNENPANNNLGPPLPSCGSALSTIATYPAARAGEIPILRLDLTSVAGGVYDRNSLMQNTDYMYLVPCTGAGASPHDFAVGAAARGTVWPVECSGTSSQPCSVDINNLIPASNTFFARIRPVYDNSSVSITATENTGSGPAPVQFAGAQVGIDVTARAGDVVRRLRASVPFSTSGDVPEAALQAFDGICKQLDVISATVPGASIIDQCTAPPPPPPGGCGLSGSFSLGGYAATLPDPNDRRFALDVAFWLPDTVPSGHHPISSPHIPLDSLGILVDPSCTYEVDFLAYCSFVDPVTGGGPDPLCGSTGIDQFFETARLEFYGSYSGAGSTLTCTGARISYADAPDTPWIPGSPATPQWSGTVPLVVDPGQSGQVRCLRIVHLCEIEPTTTAPPSTLDCTFRPMRGSVHYEEIGWNVI